MIKVVVLLRRPPSWSRERFHRWWLVEHVAYGKKLPDLRKSRGCLVTGSTSHEGREPWDGIAELWFDDREAMVRAMATPEAKALHADGALFIGRIKSFTVDEKVIIPKSDRA